MTIVKVIRAADCPDMPWKNGGGTTREIAVFPPGAGMDDFLWRLSMAKVEAAGPFSAFGGVDRTLAVLEGSLALSGPGFAVTLDDRAAPFSFGGGLSTHGEPLGGPVRDLNAMVRHGAYIAAMIRLDAGALAPCKGETFVLALKAQELGDIRLEALDCVQIDAPVVLRGPVVCVHFLPQL